MPAARSPAPLTLTALSHCAFWTPPCARLKPAFRNAKQTDSCGNNQARLDLAEQARIRPKGCSSTPPTPSLPPSSPACSFSFALGAIPFLLSTFDAVVRAIDPQGSRLPHNSPLHYLSELKRPRLPTRLHPQDVWVFKVCYCRFPSYLLAPSGSRKCCSCYS